MTKITLRSPFDRLNIYSFRSPGYLQMSQDLKTVFIVGQDDEGLSVDYCTKSFKSLVDYLLRQIDGEAELVPRMGCYKEEDTDTVRKNARLFVQKLTNKDKEILYIQNRNSPVFQEFIKHVENYSLHFQELVVED